MLDAFGDARNLWQQNILKIQMKFELDKNNLEKLSDWLKDKTNKYGGALDGRYTYCFTPTNLGVIVKVLDHISGDEIDLTDYESF